MPLDGERCYDVAGREIAQRDEGVSGRGLVLGYGNPGRGDDGLGAPPGGAAGGAPWRRRRVDLEAAFQLALEHAAAVAEHDVGGVRGRGGGRARSRSACGRLSPVGRRPRSARTSWSRASCWRSREAGFGSRHAGVAAAVRGYDFGAGEELSRAGGAEPRGRRRVRPGVVGGAAGRMKE